MAAPYRSALPDTLLVRCPDTNTAELGGDAVLANEEASGTVERSFLASEEEETQGVSGVALLLEECLERRDE